jgi:hypothetical protein
MSDFGEQARIAARRLSYMEYDSKEIAEQQAKEVGDRIAELLEEPRLDELCQKLDISTEGLANPAVTFTPQDVALASWSNIGSGSREHATRRSSLNEGEFIVLNDYFRDIREL